MGSILIATSTRRWLLVINLSILAMTMNNTATAQFLGYPIPANHPILNTTWIGRELGLDQGQPSNIGLGYLYIDNIGNYQSVSYVRSLEGCLHYGPLVKGTMMLISGQLFVAWNEGVEGVHGYLVVFDDAFKTATGTLFSATSTVIENSHWTRIPNTTDLSPVVQLLDQFLCQ